MKITQNQTASNRRPNIVKPPGLVGRNSPFQGYSSNKRAQHLTLFKSKNKKNERRQSSTW
jgi:hypothetical protein